MAQNFKNHSRLFPLHHFIYLPMSVAALITAITLAVTTDDQALAAFYILSSALLLIGGFMMRIYALKNQDRIIRMEMRQRYYELTGMSFEAKSSSLSTAQIVALRFASDEELLALIDRTINEKMAPKAIKQAIVNWKADYRRV
jgi:hypothetical protein